MRNRFAGTCYRCGKEVAPGAGHFERFNHSWRTQHASCAIEWRGKPDAERAENKETGIQWAANQTGKRAQKARRILRERDAGEIQCVTP